MCRKPLFLLTSRLIRIEFLLTSINALDDLVRITSAHINPARDQKHIMFSLRVKSVMEKENVLTASPQTTVVDAAKQMAQRQVSAVLVVDGDQLVGIFTERDAVFRVIARGLDVQTTSLSDVMTHAPITVEPDKSFGYALMVMHQNGFRHVPVVLDGKPIGLVTARSALDPDMEDFVAEEQRRRHIK